MVLLFWTILEYPPHPANNSGTNNKDNIDFFIFILFFYFLYMINLCVYYVFILHFPRYWQKYHVFAHKYPTNQRGLCFLLYTYTTIYCKFQKHLSKPQYIAIYQIANVRINFELSHIFGKKIILRLYVFQKTYSIQNKILHLKTRRSQKVRNYQKVILFVFLLSL